MHLLRAVHELEGSGDARHLGAQPRPALPGGHGRKVTGSGGTSASAPVVAGILGLLNDARLRAGKHTLGWLNPLIYGVASGTFVDVTAGYTAGCKSNVEGAAQVPGARWNATVSWDPTTGFGTPDFQKWKDLVLSI